MLWFADGRLLNETPQEAVVERRDFICHSKQMNTSPAIDAARQFLAVVWDGPPPTDAALTAALDRLITAYHVTVDAAPSDSDPVAPRDGDPALFQRVGSRFPDYGLYPLADPTGGPDAELGWGDPIDDLGDITLDMREVVWLADNATADDAHWSFRLLFFHWGTHARDLLRYLHGRQFG